MQLDAKPRKGETKEQYRLRMSEELKLLRKKQRQALKNGELEVVIDIDDFGFLLPGYDDLLKLKKSYPDFKVTCFTIPLPKEFFSPENAKYFSLEKYKRWSELINEIGWIEIAMHGFAHTPFEAQCGWGDALEMLRAGENLWNSIGLRYSKIFKAPYWQISYGFMKALEERGYVLAQDRNYPRPVPSGLKEYVYNWSLEEPLPNAKVLLGHGHFAGKNQNNLIDQLGNILRQLPAETRFLTISDYRNKYAKK